MCTRECAVAYLDVLGFKYLVSRERQLEDLPSALLDCFGGSFATEMARKCDVEYAIFSDSILARSKAVIPPYRGLANIVEFCSQMLTMSIYRRLPVRGAIAWGDVYWNAETDIRIGIPINEAVGWEVRQAWAGIMLIGSAMHCMLQHEACAQETKEHLFPLDEAILPLKDNPDEKMRAGVVRPHGSSRAEYTEMATILREIGLESCDREVQRKLERTAKLFDTHPPVHRRSTQRRAL
ncbi:hypothetical protein ACFLS0_01070 [Candidatus Bipolaricaulota bacterium]